MAFYAHFLHLSPVEFCKKYRVNDHPISFLCDHAKTIHNHIHCVFSAYPSGRLHG
nr:MAG TPA: hypothetical protein [Caudoviricetes sp.]